jgi:hypothetical protein
VVPGCGDDFACLVDRGHIGDPDVAQACAGRVPCGSSVPGEERSLGGVDGDEPCCGVRRDACGCVGLGGIPPRKGARLVPDRSIADVDAPLPPVEACQLCGVVSCELDKAGEASRLPRVPTVGACRDGVGATGHPDPLAVGLPCDVVDAVGGNPGVRPGDAAILGLHEPRREHVGVVQGCQEVVGVCGIDCNVGECQVAKAGVGHEVPRRSAVIASIDRSVDQDVNEGGFGDGVHPLRCAWVSNKTPHDGVALVEGQTDEGLAGIAGPVETAPLRGDDQVPGLQWQDVQDGVVGQSRRAPAGAVDVGSV